MESFIKIPALTAGKTAIGKFGTAFGLFSARLAADRARHFVGSAFDHGAKFGNDMIGKSYGWP